MPLLKTSPSRKADERSSARSGSGASKPEIKIILGLGNPRHEYDNTYHNAGVMALNFMARRVHKNKFKTDSSKSFQYLHLGKLVLAKSSVFMNESGPAVLKAVKHFKLKPTETLIVHDDFDIALGKYKVSFGSRSAGHKGVESVIKSFGTTDFYRLRIGVRKSRGKASIFVLKKITKSDREILEKMFLEIDILNLEI